MKRSIDTSIWGDPWFTELSANGKMVFMYLLTNERSTAAGIFDLSPRRMAFDIGIDQSTAESALEECSSRVRWWPDHAIVWVVNFFRHQAVNDNFLKSAQRTFSELPEEIRNEVVMTYPEFDVNPSGTHPEPIPTGTQTPTHIAKSEELTARSDQEIGARGERAADAAPIPPGEPDSPKSKAEKRARQIPPDWTVSDSLRKWATDHDFTDQDLAQETPKFVDYWLANGKPRKDWDAGFRLWMQNARQYGHLLAKPARPSPAKATDKITSVDELFAQGADDEPARRTEDFRDSPTSLADERPRQGGNSGMDASPGRNGLRVIASRSG